MNHTTAPEMARLHQAQLLTDAEQHRQSSQCRPDEPNNGWKLLRFFTRWPAQLRTTNR